MNINPQLTQKEIESCRDEEWIDAIYDELPGFNAENITLTDEEYKTLSFPQRWIRIMKKFSETSR